MSNGGRYGETAADRRVDERHRSDELGSEESCAGMPSRRDALKLLGAGATIAGLSTVAPGGVIAGQTRQTPASVDDYDFTVGSSTVPMEVDPTVRLVDDELVVSGSLLLGSSSCGTIALDQLVYDDEIDRLTIAVTGSTIPDGGEPVDCTDDEATKSYELRMPVDDVPDSVRVVETDLEGSRMLTFDGRDVPILEGVDEYELSVSLVSLDDTGSNPVVRFEDDAVVVSGVIVIGSSSCKTVGVTWMNSNGGLSVDVEDVRTPDPTSDDVVRDCTDDYAAAAYELTVPFDDPPGAVIAAQKGLEEGRVHLERRDVEGPPQSIDGSQPQDLNGDGLYEDVNGNGRGDFDDVVTFFEHVNELAVRDYVEAYDFNATGRIDFDDVVALLKSA